ncbi:hypothetical protein K3495_g10850 [Podosphaera aphanis]|nr:hypothetical protein K3495_g10850 [Podosphaera aphanis]
MAARTPPSPIAVPEFKGTDATRWLLTCWGLWSSHGWTRETIPCGAYIEFLNTRMAADSPASDYFDNSPEIQSITKKTDATLEDVLRVEALLISRFPKKLNQANEVSPLVRLEAPRQGNSSLKAYFEECEDVINALASDIPSSGIPVDNNQIWAVNRVLEKSLNNLSDERLKRAVHTQFGVYSKSLPEVYVIAKRRANTYCRWTSAMLAEIGCDKADYQSSSARVSKLSEMNSMQALSAALERRRAQPQVATYTPATRVNHPHDPHWTVPAPALERRRAQPQVATYTPATRVNHPHDPHWTVPAPGNFDFGLQTQESRQIVAAPVKFDFSFESHQNAHQVPPQTPSTALIPYNRPASPQNDDYMWEGCSRETHHPIPQRRLSTHPFFRDPTSWSGQMCRVRCAKLDHPITHCSTNVAQHLAFWEQGYLHALISPENKRDGSGKKGPTGLMYAAKRFYDNENLPLPGGTNPAARPSHRNMTAPNQPMGMAPEMQGANAATFGNRVGQVADPEMNSNQVQMGFGVNFGVNRLWDGQAPSSVQMRDESYSRTISPHNSDHKPIQSNTTKFSAKPIPVEELFARIQPVPASDQTQHHKENREPFSVPIDPLFTSQQQKSPAESPLRGFGCKSPQTYHTYQGPYETRGTKTAENSEPTRRRSSKSKVTGDIRALTKLAAINGKKGMIPLAAKELLESTMVSISLLELAQYSPAFAQDAKNLISRKNRDRRSVKPKQSLKPVHVESDTLMASFDTLIDDLKRTQAYALQVNEQINNSLDVNEVEATSLEAINPHIVTAKREDKAFRLPGFISFGKGSDETDPLRHVDVWAIPNCHIICDQGSELNLITPKLAQLLHMPLYEIEDGIGIGMGMRSANSEFSSLKHFVTFEFEIDGVHRVVSAFVRPDSTGRALFSDLSLILGQPWIWTVHGVPDVRGGTLHFGDETLGEVRQVLHTTKFFQSKYQKLLLIPDLSPYREKAEMAERLMEQQTPIDMSTRPLVTRQREYYITSMAIKYALYHITKTFTSLTTTYGKLPDPDINLSDNYHASPQLIHEYQTKVGSIGHAAMFTRPDMAKSFSLLAEHLANPNQDDFYNANRCIQYLYGTRFLAILYHGNKGSVEVLDGASTAAFAGNS